jgi:hypothetical protein
VWGCSPVRVPETANEGPRAARLRHGPTGSEPRDQEPAPQGEGGTTKGTNGTKSGYWSQHTGLVSTSGPRHGTGSEPRDQEPAPQGEGGTMKGTNGTKTGPEVQGWSAPIRSQQRLEDRMNGRLGSLGRVCPIGRTSSARLDGQGGRGRQPNCLLTPAAIN